MYVFRKVDTIRLNNKLTNVYDVYEKNPPAITEQYTPAITEELVECERPGVTVETSRSTVIKRNAINGTIIKRNATNALVFCGKAYGRTRTEAEEDFYASL